MRSGEVASREEMMRASGAVVEATTAQIAKDFNLAGVDWLVGDSWPGHYEALYNRMKEVILRMLEHPGEDLARLLYHFDISPAVIAQTQIEYPTQSEADILAELLIQRAFRKVMLRKYFKDHPGSLDSL